MKDFSRQIIGSRARLLTGKEVPRQKDAEEGGCGVVGFAASVPVSGRIIYEPSIQMHNRGNGKGGGIAAGGLVAGQMGVDAATLRDDYILQVALLDPKAEKEVEKKFVLPNLDVHHKTMIKPVADYREFGLPCRPPDVARYFVRAKKKPLDAFASRTGMKKAPRRAVEDEFIFQNSAKLNQEFYAPLGEKRAFVMSHARDLVIFKIVGYAENVVQVYGLDGMLARVWIAHQRYPTKGRVWHPAGAHPFIGMNEALVHNGDFANYASITDYLRQYNVAPQFLTDTEVSVLLFDLWHRVQGYSIEHVIEGLAPTTELDFDRLPAERKKAYRAIQSLRMHGSPDGPWFFIIARSEPDKGKLELLGITDTAMLRPQVFALQEGEVSIGLIASEKQAIDATLQSLSKEDPRFRPVADKYWNARGGSHTDGGAFIFTVGGDGKTGAVTCADKFGTPVKVPGGNWRFDPTAEPQAPAEATGLAADFGRAGQGDTAEAFYSRVSGMLAGWDIDGARWLFRQVGLAAGRDGQAREWALNVLALFHDRRYNCGMTKRSVILQLVEEAIDALLAAVPAIAGKVGGAWKQIDYARRADLRAPGDGETTLVINAHDFPPEGDDCDARLAVGAFQSGWKRFILYGLKGQRYTGCGFGPATDGVRIDVFGSSGDYLSSGVDGMEIYVHGSAQDQLCQIMKRGTLVVHGDIGQTFMYGAKGGEVYIKGNAAGRPVINAVGRPRVVINGTCLDFLAESFMAGDPHQGGGFVILNGIQFDDHGGVAELESPYPGSNLFSLASGGALFIRDPHKKIVAEQLNGGGFARLTDEDWQLILPYLESNERHFGISIEKHLLTVDGVRRAPAEVYRKVHVAKSAVSAKEKDTEED